MKKHTEIQILALAKDILKDIKFNYIDPNSFSTEYRSVESLLEGKEKLQRFEEYKKIVKPYWSVHFEFLQEMEARLPYVGLNIYDETGIPFELRTWQAVYTNFKKDENGKWEMN